MICTFFRCISYAQLVFRAHKHCVHMYIFPFEATARQRFQDPNLNIINLHVCKHMCISKYMQRRYINMSIDMVLYTCSFSFLFWCWFWISFGSWEAIICVVDPWWSYKALLTAVGLEGKKNTKLEPHIQSNSKIHFELASFKIYSMHSIWAIRTFCQAPTMYSDETVWNGCIADK